MTQQTLRVSEIFPSIDGEVNLFGMGGWTIFVRLQGCSANCSFCDTEYAKSSEGGSLMSTSMIINTLRTFKINKVTITGGEPLEQEEALVELLEELTVWGYKASIETNGYHSIKNLKKRFPQVSFVVDCKLEAKPPWQNFIGLKENDFVKFLVGSVEDLGRLSHLSGFILACGKPQLAISPIISVDFSASDVVNYILRKDIFQYKLNIQLHKLLNLR